jgi:TetR/AcrR family transcriptional regulator
MKDAKNSTEKLSRKERERLEHQDEILDAAEAVFIRKGYYQASVEEIAREAEFSVGTIYNFFENKGNLYANVLERIAEEFMSQLESRVLLHNDPEEALSALVELRLTHFEAHRGFFRVFFESAPGNHMDPVSALPDSCKGLYERYIAAVRGIIERGMECGVFRSADPAYLALCAEGIAAASVSYWAQQDTLEPIEVRVRKTSDALLSWLRKGKV